MGLQSAKSTSGVWKALIKFAQFDHVFAIPIVLFTKVCLVYFTNVMMGETWQGIGVVALSKTISFITPATQPCAMLMPMVDPFFFAIQIRECVCFIGAFLFIGRVPCFCTMGPRAGAVRSVCLRVKQVRRDIEKKKMSEETLWQLRRKPNSANVLNGHLIFAPVDSDIDLSVWRRSWIHPDKYRTARTMRQFWDGSPFGIGKWPHMLPVRQKMPLEDRIIRLSEDRTKSLLKALQLDDVETDPPPFLLVYSQKS